MKVRSDFEVSYHFPQPTHSYKALLKSMIDQTYWEKHKISKKERLKFNNNLQISLFEENNEKALPWKTVRDAIYDLPDPEKLRSKSNIITNHTFKPGARAYKGHIGSVLDYPAKTLKAGSHGVPGGENALRKIDGSLRYFTIRESARLQGFPDDFEFNCSWGQAMNQLGNAVPIPLAEILGKSIKKAIIKK